MPSPVAGGMFRMAAGQRSRPSAGLGRAEPGAWASRWPARQGHTPSGAAPTARHQYVTLQAGTVARGPLGAATTLGDAYGRPHALA